MLKQGHGRVIVMSPPIDTTHMKGRVAYYISKFGMTLLAIGLAQEIEGSGVTINALWPATLIESYATINHNLGNRSLWRTTKIITDCTMGIVTEDESVNGNCFIDEDYLRSKGITDFVQYRCDPDVEPPKIIEGPMATLNFGNVGLISDAKQRSKL
eukprot:TRINITY_DN4919_c0_g1_i1.p1 TRINITY_DN4919_c0_g1~~TRINITY_DN4919_c0_g1_i1.p1  ORF type:complete len:156 (+),score=31.61 TRINITY_DN4919_c0_g1_i1:469-936(+)